MKRALVGFCAALLVATLASRAMAQSTPQFVMKMGTASINDQQHEWLKMYKAAVEKDSGGRIRVDIFPLSQLGSIPREIEDTQFGAIQGWVGPPEFLTGIDQRFELLGIPGVFQSTAQFDKTVLDPAFATPFLSLAESKGLLGVSLFYAGQQSLITRREVTKLGEAQGLKLRVTAGPVLEAMTHAINATGIPMPLDQVLAALQQGALDGTITTLAVVTPQKFYTIAPYTMPMPGYVADITIISKSWVATLPPDLQKIVVNDGFATGRNIVPFALKYVADQDKVWTDHGGKIRPFSADDERRLQAALAPIGDTVTATNPDVSAMYKLLVATAAKYR